MNADSFIDIIGFMSSMLITIMFIPEIHHVYANKDTSSLNYYFLILNILASTLGLVYSVYYVVVPIIIANTSGFLFSSFLLLFKIHNEKLSII